MREGEGEGEGVGEREREITSSALTTINASFWSV